MLFRKIFKSPYYTSTPRIRPLRPACTLRIATEYVQRWQKVMPLATSVLRKKAELKNTNRAPENGPIIHHSLTLDSIPLKISRVPVMDKASAPTDTCRAHFSGWVCTIVSRDPIIFTKTEYFLICCRKELLLISIRVYNQTNTQSEGIIIPSTPRDVQAQR